MRRNLKLSSLFCGAVAALSLLASCQDYEAMDTNEIMEFQTLEKYSNNFVAHYGQPDPNHSWGMGVMPLNVVSGQSQSLTSRSTIDNRNQWDPLNENENVYHLQVPGWPDTYLNQYQTQDGGYKTSGDLLTSDIPGGDVTYEEIQYVSWWFRTHQYPSNDALHWTDFFVQEVSSDYDRDSEGNAIKEASIFERSAADAAFNKTGSTTVTYGMDYLKAYTIEPIIGDDGNIYKDPVTGEDVHWDHLNNFNSGKSNNLHTAVTVPMGSDPYVDMYNSSNQKLELSSRLIDFFQSSGTEDFLCKYSDDNTDRTTVKDKDGNEHRSWVLKHLEFTGASGRHYDGYYLAFDYEHYSQEDWEYTWDEETKTNIPQYKKKYARIDADGYYSNWIVKLSPGTPIEEPEYTGQTRRVMCEDLGNTYDFDFNDVVFDATYNMTKADYAAYAKGEKTQSPIDVTIRLQAAGGTMPIYVGKMPDDANGAFEAHHLLNNNSTKTPVNVSSVKSPIATYHIKIEVDSSNPSDALNLNSIPIYVVTSGNAEGVRNGHYIVNGSPETHYTPQNPGVSNTPQKFAVPTNVRWMRECKFIETAYPKFVDWVREEWGEYRVREDYHPTYPDNAPTWKKAWCDDDNIDPNFNGNLY
ncbi:MAG: hypothetical protein KBT29_05050 [Prevotellaceae bacterium]|nr:hypothetical protein [Candidatus Minthosoma caballi]